MDRLGRDMPLPEEMQGHWIDADDKTSELVVNGGEITCFGKAVEYDYKIIRSEDDALMVSLKIENEANEDAFQHANITELVITPEGDFHAYNTQFASQFVRAVV
ncbi:hypothetical protein DMC47_40910 [Nostoc sp. 3335mG]|nr:hypothetical protein DMC47_40910 [Nostoc sp. 3335mG]